jgi:hypothetical protein
MLNVDEYECRCESKINLISNNSISNSSIRRILFLDFNSRFTCIILGLVLNLILFSNNKIILIIIIFFDS